MAQLIYGKNTVYSALEESKVKKLFLQSNFSDSKMLALIKKNNVPYTYKNSSELLKMSKGGNHQGVIAIVPPFNYASVEDILDEDEVLDLLEDIAYVGGAVISDEYCDCGEDDCSHCSHDCHNNENSENEEDKNDDK